MVVGVGDSLKEGVAKGQEAWRAAESSVTSKVDAMVTQASAGYASWSTPQEMLVRGLKQTSISLTIGVFLGAAVSGGLLCGGIAWYVANKQLFGHAAAAARGLIANARKAVLATPEGEALSKALIENAREAGTPTALGAQNAFRSVDSRDLSPEDLLRMLEDLSARVTKLEALGGRPAAPATSPEPAASAGKDSLAFSMTPGGDFA